jgi:hypothetical protein
MNVVDRRTADEVKVALHLGSVGQTEHEHVTVHARRDSSEEVTTPMLLHFFFLFPFLRGAIFPGFLCCEANAHAENSSA